MYATIKTYTAINREYYASRFNRTCEISSRVFSVCRRVFNLIITTRDQQRGIKFSIVIFILYTWIRVFLMQ